MDETTQNPNHLLASLSAVDFEVLRPHLQPVELRHETVLYDVGDDIDRVYFPHAGVVSLVVNLASGETIETGMVGRDSIVGGASALDGKVSLNKAIVQIAGTASALKLDHLRRLADASAAFRTTLIRHEQLILVQAQQSAACNIAHTLETRLARWLSRCRDLTDCDDLALTQNLLLRCSGCGVRASHLSPATCNMPA